jgi:hypothetical protein
MVEAEYLAEERVLKLTHPLEGVHDHERVNVVIEQSSVVSRGDWPAVGDEAGNELAQAVRDAFGRDEIGV